MSSIATTNETSNVTSLPTAPKPQTSKEVIAANVKLLIEQLEAGHSEGLTAYLTAMGKFHSYSLREHPRNRPTNAFGQPRSGALCVEPTWPQGEEGTEGHPHSGPHARHANARRTRKPRKTSPSRISPCWSDSAPCTCSMCRQTEGAELPDLKERVKGDVGEYRERLIDFILAQGIELEFKESIAPALGMSYGGKIAILPGQSAAEEFSTLVHEASHELLHKCSRRTATTKTVRETEAEAIAFVVSQTIGLDAGNAAADYIHLYNGDAALLAESLEVIQRTSALILSAIETPEVVQDPTEEKPAEQPTTTQDATDAALAEVA